MPPLPIVGFTRDQFIDNLVDTVGNTSASFRAQCVNNMTAWVEQFYAESDWKFTYKNGVADNFKFTSLPGVSTYTINTANFGFESDATYIESVYTQTLGQQRKLIKFELQDLRVGDPGQICKGYPNYWFPSGNKGVVLYPTPMSGQSETIYCDGKVIGQEINSNVVLPIPYKLQDLFFQFCLCKCLRRERDPRRKEETQYYEIDKRKAISDDIRDEESNLRFETVNEKLGVAVPNDLNTRLWFTPYN